MYNVLYVDYSISALCVCVYVKSQIAVKFFICEIYTLSKN